MRSLSCDLPEGGAERLEAVNVLPVGAPGLPEEDLPAGESARLEGGPLRTTALLAGRWSEALRSR